MTNHYPEIPWPTTLDNLEKDDWGNYVVGQYRIGEVAGVYPNEPTSWHYFNATGESLGGYPTLLEAINEGALRDNYRSMEEV